MSGQDRPTHEYACPACLDTVTGCGPCSAALLAPWTATPALAPADDDRPLVGAHAESVAELEAWSLDGLERSRARRAHAHRRRTRRLAGALVALTAAPFAASALANLPS